MIDDSETIERAALESLHACASADLRDALGLTTDNVAGAFVSAAAALPATAIVVNRTIGLGLAEPADRAAARDVVGAYSERGIARFFVHQHPDAKAEDLASWLAEEGLVRARGWMKFMRGTEQPPSAATELRIAKIGPAHGSAFGAIVADAFDLGWDAVDWLARLPGAPGWHIYMSFAGDEPAGTGALFVRDGVGWCDWGATAPAFRGRGSQSALLARRIGDAIAFGCQSIHTCTGEDVPGDPQHSYNNIMRMGFRETYVRANYAPPKA